MIEKTDLNKCKRVARQFLGLDLKQTFEFTPDIISHPFFENAYIINQNTGELANILTDKNAYNYAISKMKEAINKIDDYYQFTLLITRPYRLAFLKYTKEYINRADLSEYLIDTWVNDEYANRNPDVPKKELLKYFKDTLKEKLMDNEEFKVYEELDDIVTIYRGVTDYNKEDVKAMSWTLDLNIAKWFAHRFELNGYVYEAKINKKDIFAFCDMRNEKEVIVDYTKLYDLKLLSNM